MSLYVDYVYQVGELYSNDDMTGFIGLEDSGDKPVWSQIKMLFKMLTKKPGNINAPWFSSPIVRRLTFFMIPINS